MVASVYMYKKLNFDFKHFSVMNVPVKISGNRIRVRGKVRLYTAN